MNSSFLQNHSSTLRRRRNSIKVEDNPKKDEQVVDNKKSFNVGAGSSSSSISGMLEDVADSLQTASESIGMGITTDTVEDIFKELMLQKILTALNTASEEELKKLKGMGKSRVKRILELREGISEPFKNIKDIEGFGLSQVEIKALLSQFFLRDF